MTQSVNPRPPRSLIWLLLATAVVVAILLSLGTWQVRRLAEKQALVAHVRLRIKEPPVPLPPPSLWASMDPLASDYMPVRLTGRFDPEREFDVFATLAEPKGKEGGVGWFVFAPFVETDGGTVLVNRGFVPDRLKDRARRADPLPTGETTLTGLLRRPEGSNLFTPANNLERNQWFTRDPEAMARVMGLKPDRILPFYIDADATQTPPGGFPQAGETVIEFPNNHLGYAITWYGLAAAAVTMSGLIVVRRRKAASAP